MGSSCDKARTKVQDKLRALGKGPESTHPAAVHGRVALELYGALKGAVQRFEQGDEDAVSARVWVRGGWCRPFMLCFVVGVAGVAG